MQPAFQHTRLGTYRNAISMAHSGLKRMGGQGLHAVTTTGFGIRVYTSSPLALAFTVLLKEAAVYQQLGPKGSTEAESLSG